MRLTLPLLKKMGEWSKKFANYPDRFVDRWLETGGKIIHPDSLAGKPQRCPKLPKRPRNYFFGTTRPWNISFVTNNARKQPYVHVEPLQKWSFFRGDLVEILVGPDKGKQGRVKYIYEESNLITVDGLNTTLKILTEDNIKFAMRFEKPLLVTAQVQLVDPSDLEATDIEWRYTEDGEHVRVSTRTGRIIPIPISAWTTKDYDVPEKYVNGPKDTTKEHVQEITFEPGHCTFEMDIMQSMGIVETRVPKKSFWY